MLDQVPFLRLVEVPRYGGDPPNPGASAGRRALATALASAHAAGAPAAVVWLRASPGDRLSLLVGGSLLSNGAPLLPGARGEPVEPGQAVSLLRRLPHWLRCTAEHLPPATARPTDQSADSGVTLADLLVQLGPEPFGWLAFAEPMASADALALADDLHYQHASLVDRAELSVRDSLALEQLRSRHRSLVHAATAGVWRVHVLAGGATETFARSVASLLCAGSDPHPLPYLLVPTGKVATLDDVLATPAARPAPLDGPPLDGSPFVAGCELLAAIAPPPSREVPGVRVVEPPAFDLTPEVPGEIPLGHVLDEAGRPAGRFDIALSTLNRHALVAGATGAGKSQTVRHLLEGLHHAGIPWLVVEPVKAEYAGMAGRLPDRATPVVVRPGDPQTVPVSLNPLAPEPGFPLQTHVDLVRALFLAAFAAHEPFPQILASALVRCYQRLGWSLASGEPSTRSGATPRYPYLADLQQAAREVVAEIGYGAELTADVRGFVEVRLGSLRLGGAGRFFEGGHPLDLDNLLSRNAVVELEQVGNDQDKAFVIGAVLIRLAEHLRVQAGSGMRSQRLRHVTVVEEAHRLLRAAAADTPAGHAVELFAALLAEVRAYGEAIVVVEQIPTKLLPDVVKNTALKVLHRLPASDDRDVVGATMNLDPRQSRYVVSLSPGQAAVFSDGMDRPVLIEVPLGQDRERRAAGPATPRLSGRRSPACGPSCQRRACTAREIAWADLLADDPRLTLWIELLTLAHVVGEPRPVPRRDMVADLRGPAPDRVVECGLATLSQRSVDCRYPRLAASYQPEQLAAHLATVATAVLLHGALPCQPAPEAEWQAGRYRLAAAVRALTSWDGPRDQPHPETTRWRRRGLPVPEASADAQLVALRQHPDIRADPDALLFGEPAPGPLRNALDALGAATPRADRLREATSFLQLDDEWVTHWVLPAEGE